PTPAPTEAAAEEDEAEEIAAINELPTEVPGAPVLSLPTAHPAPVPVYVPASRPVVVAPVAVRTYPAPRPVAPVPAPAARTSPVASSPWAAAGTYTVAPHETLYALARRVGVRPTELAAWNNLPPTAALQVGQTIRISPPAQLLTARASTATHTVTTGDTLFNISQRYGCTVSELQASNGKAEPTLRVGEILRVPTH
ncbi:MAG: LysM peptidoglycan-binding domain-containing protein, partial [Hymenobacter sp.]